MGSKTLCAELCESGGQKNAVRRGVWIWWAEKRRAQRYVDLVGRKNAVRRGVWIWWAEQRRA